MAPTSQADFLAALDQRVAQCWCMEPWVDATHVPVQMECCKQLAGTECIKQWVASSAVNNNKCPSCRQELFRKAGTPAVSPPRQAIPLIWSESYSGSIFLLSPSTRPLPIHHRASTAAPLIPTESSIRSAFLSALSTRPLPTPQPALAVARPPLASPAFPLTSIGGTFSMPLSAADITEYRNEAFHLWKALFANPSIFAGLWEEVQVKPRWPLATQIKWHYTVTLLHTAIRQESVLAAGDGRNDEVIALRRYLLHLERLPAQNLAHTNKHTHSIVAIGPLYYCVDFMMKFFNLVHHVQPTQNMGSTLAAVTDHVYYGRGDGHPVSDEQPWDLIFGEAVSLRRREDVATLRILTALLMCHSLSVVKRAFGSDTSQYDLGDHRCLVVLGMLPTRPGLRPQDKLEELARMPDYELLLYWNLA